MPENKELTFERETVEISGGRELHNYRFSLDGEPLPCPPVEVATEPDKAAG
jgi:hypothetical protein